MKRKINMRHIGAWVQNFPDGQKCQGLACTIKERFLGAPVL